MVNHDSMTIMDWANMGLKGSIFLRKGVCKFIFEICKFFYSNYLQHFQSIKKGVWNR